jgi:5,6-dimethylbenzimidazole synthase
MTLVHPDQGSPVLGAPPEWDTAFRGALETLLHWRRDVRHFRTDAVPVELITQLLGLACQSPSVGNSQPWRFVFVADELRREAVIENFNGANRDALMEQHPERQAAYASLKLAGLREAPIHLAVFCDEAGTAGHGLGRRTMPEMLAYSVVCAIHAFWLGARAHGLGVGWVSILDPATINTIVDVPQKWKLIAYLCVGWPAEEHDTPELQRRGWQDREDAGTFVFRR